MLDSKSSDFLKEKIQLDANWAGVVDQLNVAKRVDEFGALPNVAEN
jgi:hypothetical protein